jgi:hypothetical protein
MAEEAAAARGEDVDEGAGAPLDPNKTCGRGDGLQRLHPVLIEIARLLARSEARRLRS